MPSAHHNQDFETNLFGPTCPWPALLVILRLMITIKKAIIYGPGDLRIEDQLYDPATLKPSQILVRTEATGFSTGTELANYEGRSTEVPDAPAYPRVVGYSNVGVVEGVGNAVRLFHPGDRIFSMKHHCSAYVADEGEMLVRVPEGVDVDHASLTYLVHLGVAALRQVGYEAGEDVLVIGLGAIGLCTVAAARAMGARVISVANDNRRAEIARSLGSIETLVTGSFVPRTVFGGQGADIVVLTANTWSAYRASVEMVRHAGRISVLGFPGRAQPAPDFNPVDMRWLYGKQLTIKGVGHIARVDCDASEIRFNLRRDIKYVLDLMASGALNLAPVISHRIPHNNMKEAYELARQHSKELSAAVFHWS
jgi:threonine dehydrogenase-like Zn-dependent dehydrogenase